MKDHHHDSHIRKYLCRNESKWKNSKGQRRLHHHSVSRFRRHHWLIANWQAQLDRQAIQVWPFHRHKYLVVVVVAQHHRHRPLHRVRVQVVVAHRLLRFPAQTHNHHHHHWPIQINNKYSVHHLHHPHHLAFTHPPPTVHCQPTLTTIHLPQVNRNRTMTLSIHTNTIKTKKPHRISAFFPTTTIKRHGLNLWSCHHRWCKNGRNSMLILPVRGHFMVPTILHTNHKATHSHAHKHQTPVFVQHS